MNRRYVFLVEDNGGVFQANSENLGGSNSESNISDEEKCSIISLKHPRSGELLKYMAAGQDILELQKVSVSKYSSFFIDNSVKSDAVLWVGTRVDPLLLLLPCLAHQAQARFVPLDQAVSSSSGDDDSLQLLKCRHLDLDKICDVNDKLGPETMLYRLNEGKVVGWLKGKVERAQRHLARVEPRADDPCGGAGDSASFAAGFQAPRTDASAGAADSGGVKKSLRQAVQVVLEYTAERWRAPLLESLGLDEAVLEPPSRKAAKSKQQGKADDEPATAGERRAQQWQDAATLDKALEYTQGLGSSGAETDPAKKKQKLQATTRTTGNKKLTKGKVTGMKTISSFFQKK